MKTDIELIKEDTDRVGAIHKCVRILIDAGLFRSCYNCEHWLEGPPDNKLQICGKYKQRPPTKVIVCGCDSHSDQIPF